MSMARPLRSRAFRLIRGLLAASLVAYGLIVGAFWYWQASFIFQPSPVVNTTPADLGVAFDQVTLPLGTGSVAGWWVPTEAPQAWTLLYLHGNANNVGSNADQVLRLGRGASVNVLIIDYRGYGQSTGGPPREAMAYEDAERAWTYLVTERKTPPADIVIYGHSLGAAVAVDLASKHPEAGALVTEGAFTSVVDLGNEMSVGAFLPLRLIVTERFDTLSKMGSVRVPTLILQGEFDHPEMARRLFEESRDPKQLALIPGGGHEDSAEVNPAAYFGAVNGFLSQRVRPR